MHLTIDSPFIEYDELFELARDNKINAIDLEYYQKYYTVSQAIQVYGYETRCANYGFRKHKMYEMYRGADSWDVPSRSYRLKLKKLKIAALNKGKQVAGGLMRQSAELRKALSKTLTFYHVSGVSTTIEPQPSAAAVYKKLQTVVPTTVAVQGLQRMIRQGRGTFFGWSFVKPVANQHIVVNTLDAWREPKREAEVITGDQLAERTEGNYACAVTGKLKELSPKTVLSPATAPRKGGRTLVACLENVMVLKKGLQTLLVYGAKNLAVIAREADISLAALRHLVYQRCHTANGWSLAVYN